MEFDKSRVYTAVNADEVKVGSKVICADTLFQLKDCTYRNVNIREISAIRDDDYTDRFVVRNDDDSRVFNLVYLIEEPSEKKLKWTDLKIGDVVKEKEGTEIRMVTAIDTSNEPDGEGDICHICLADWWCTDKALEEWEKVE